MRKWAIIILAVLLAVSFSGCGKSQAVKDTEAAIEKIGEVNLDSGRKITAAEKLYNELSEKEQEKVGNYATLQYSRKVYDALQNQNYYDAICLYAEQNDVNGIRTIIKKCEYGDKAVMIAVCSNNRVIAFVKGIMPKGTSISGGDYWFTIYSFPSRGLPQRISNHSEKNYTNAKQLAEDAIALHWADEVLYTFDFS